MRPLRLLLVNPAYGASFWGLDYACGLARARYTLPPLGLVTVAALTPPEWEITVVDENVEPVDVDFECDVVGLTAMNVQAARAFALADAFRRRGRLVVMGGPFATLQPDRCAAHADVLVVGEAEHTWPALCRELPAMCRAVAARGCDPADGRPALQIREHEPVDLTESPVPRYDLLRPGAYAALSLQTTRGCPFACEFCDIIVMQGRRVRAKTPAQVVAEMEAIRAAGGRAVFFADDNFVGNQKHTREVLADLIVHRKNSWFAPVIYTQASLNLADKPAMLEQMVDGGFTRVFVGIESPRQASLREAGKRQNEHGDLVDRVHTLQRAGLMVWAGMIVGFDHDDDEIFREQAEFLDAASISVAMVGMLNAPPKTPLFTRLHATDRIDPDADWADNCAYTNIVPAQMSRARLFEGYAELIEHIYDPARYARRVVDNILRMGPARPGQTGGRLPAVADFQDLARALAAYGLTRSADRRRLFLPNLLRVARQEPSRVVEAAIHLGMWMHFERYVPELSGKLRTAADAERVRARERAWRAAVDGPAPSPAAGASLEAAAPFELPAAGDGLVALEALA